MNSPTEDPGEEVVSHDLLGLSPLELKAIACGLRQLVNRPADASVEVWDAARLMLAQLEKNNDPGDLR